MRVKDIIGDNSIWMPNGRYEEIHPLVTVILPTYSRAKNGLLRQCVDSVLGQSFRRLELIIVDDGSVDGTFDICQKYMWNDPRVSIIRHKKNIGLPAISTYEAYRKARGEYIAYVFDDNQWKLDALAKTYDFMEENQVKASYGITQVTDSKTGKTVEFGANQKTVSANLWMENCIGESSVLLHREVLETVGLHDPHLSLTRICDWDLWLRITEQYEFVATGIIFTFEHGTTQLDSLGNAFKLDQWFAFEWQQSRNADDLMPSVYEDYDIIGQDNKNSAHFKMCLREHYLQYSKRYWFEQEALDHISNMQTNTKHKRVMVLAHITNASCMSFTRYRGKDYTFAYVTGNSSLAVLLLALTDIVIFARAFWSESPIRGLCQQLSIPCYYYVDDNFRECAFESNDIGTLNVAKETSAKNLAMFEGVIVSTQQLQNYFQKTHLHENVIQLDPIFRETFTGRKMQIPFTVGFMGGAYRQGVLKSCVLPALKKLAADQKLRFICPCLEGEEKSLLKLSEGSLEIIPVPRTDNYEYVLHSFYQIGIDVLVHCGSNVRNNLYKTKNAMLNAVTLGVPLLVSDIEPYCCREPDEPEQEYLLVRNTPDAWYDALKSVAQSSNLRKAFYETAHKYCVARYSSDNAWKAMDQELGKYVSRDSFHYLRQYEKLCIWLQKNSVQGGGVGGHPTWRPFIPEQLSCSNEMRLPRRFGFTSSVATIREIGLLFAIVGECTGTVWVRIYRKGEIDPLAERSLSVEKLVPNGYTNIYLDEAIVVKTDGLLYLELDVQYEEKNGYVAVFEDRERRTFWYKVFNKLGHPLPGKNALFVDCRS